MCMEKLYVCCVSSSIECFCFVMRLVHDRCTNANAIKQMKSLWTGTDEHTMFRWVSSPFTNGECPILIWWKVERRRQLGRNSTQRGTSFSFRSNLCVWSNTIEKTLETLLFNIQPVCLSVVTCMFVCLVANDMRHKRCASTLWRWHYDSFLWGTFNVWCMQMVTYLASSCKGKRYILVNDNKFFQFFVCKFNSSTKKNRYYNRFHEKLKSM